jgi:hypothetical protein
MAKKLPRSIAQQPLQVVPADDETLIHAREAHASREDVAGGAWNAAGKAALGGELAKRKDELRESLLRGDLVFEVTPDQMMSVAIGSGSGSMTMHSLLYKTQSASMVKTRRYRSCRLQQIGSQISTIKTVQFSRMRDSS